MRIVQISDMHVFSDKAATLLNLNTWQSCQAVMHLAAANHKKPDMVILSGDISQDYAKPSYLHVAKLCDIFTCPVYWFPGNHDHPETMQQAFSQTSLKDDKIIHWQSWTLLLLNSHWPGKVAGYLAAAQLEWLAQQLNNYKNQHILIFLHHHPIAVKSEWLDQSMLKNATDFFTILKEHTQVRGIICGHVHQVFEKKWRKIPILSAPSTCIQFLPKSRRFALDTVYPGYRWLDLNVEGTFETGVERVTKFNNTADFKATGY